MPAAASVLESFVWLTGLKGAAERAISACARVYEVEKAPNQKRMPRAGRNRSAAFSRNSAM